MATLRSFVKFQKGNLRGVGGVCYILERNLMPEGVCCAQTLPALFSNRCSTHPGTSGPNLSLSAY